MKFDTPATTNPIDQLKVIGQADRPDRRPAEDYRYRALRLRAARCRCRTRPTATFSVQRSRRAGFASMDLMAARAHPACSPSSPPKTPASSPRGTAIPRCCWAVPRSSTTTRRSRSSSPRRSSRRARRAHLVRVDYARAKGAFDLEAVQGFAPISRRNWPQVRLRHPPSAILPAPSPRRPCKLDATYTHGIRIARDDGAARDDRRLGWGPAHTLDVEPDDRLDRGATWRDARDSEGEDPRHVAVSSAVASAESCSCARMCCWPPSARARLAARESGACSVH